MPKAPAAQGRYRSDMRTAWNAEPAKWPAAARGLSGIIPTEVWEFVTASVKRP